MKRKQQAEEKFKKWLEAKNQARKAERERRDKQVLKERKENEMKKQISEAKFKEWLRYVWLLRYKCKTSWYNCLPATLLEEA